MKHIIISFVAASLLVLVGVMLKLQDMACVANVLLAAGMAVKVLFWYLLIRYLIVKFAKKDKETAK